jgi:CRISPR system Cascade subunit CasE
MYLSKLELNPRSREARRDLARPYELHRTLARAFPTPEGQDYRAAHGVLFRLEPTQPGQPPVVLIQSRTAPDWSLLPDAYTSQPVLRQDLRLTLAVGQVLGFRLVANPTRKIVRVGQRQGKRVPLYDSGDAAEGTPALQWLRRKAALSGFEILHVLSEGFTLNASDANGSSKNTLPLYGVRFDGLLRVTDPALVTSTLQQGLGSAKAFGFGLLSLAKPVQ